MLGTEVTIHVTNRIVSVSPSKHADILQVDTSMIDSDIQVRVCLIGISVKKTRFSSHMVIDPLNGLVEEFLEHEDGARTEIRAVSSTAE